MYVFLCVYIHKYVYTHIYVIHMHLCVCGGKYLCRNVRDTPSLRIVLMYVMEEGE